MRPRRARTACAKAMARVPRVELRLAKAVRPNRSATCRTGCTPIDSRRLPPLLAVHLGAGNAAKRWPTDSWKILIERFLDSGWRVVVVGGIEDLPLSDVLEPHDRLRDWTGSLTVTQTTALLERADLFIGADSGPAHLAASAGTLSVILFSGTNQPRQWRPWSRHSLVLRHRVPCQPCHQKVCPLADHPCMSGLSPDRVYRGRDAVVVSHAPGGVAARAAVEAVP